MVDKRRYKRFMVLSKIECYRITGETINISRKGMQINANILLPINTDIPFYIFYKGNKMLKISGHVIWTDNGNKYGIRSYNFV